jgi:hypothetical protein
MEHQKVSNNRKQSESTLCAGCKNLMDCRNLNNWLEIPKCVIKCKIIDYNCHDAKFTKALIVEECKNHIGG